MSDLLVGASEVRDCRACFQRVVWLQNAYGKWNLINVPDSERSKSWLTVDDKHRHNCPKKEYFKILKARTRR